MSMLHMSGLLSATCLPTVLSILVRPRTFSRLPLSRSPCTWLILPVDRCWGAEHVRQWDRLVHLYAGAPSAARFRRLWRSCRHALFREHRILAHDCFCPMSLRFAKLPGTGMPQEHTAIACRVCCVSLPNLQEEHPDIAFVKIDTTDEEMSKVAEEEAVSVLPTFKFYKDGKEVCFRDFDCGDS